MKFNFLKRRHKDDVVELKESFYCCIINDNWFRFSQKEAMLDFIEKYSSKNTIYKLSMFRTDMFNLIK